MVIAPKDRIIGAIDPHPPVPLALFLPIVDMQNVLVFPRLLLHQPGAGHPDLFVGRQRLGERTASAPAVLGQDLSEDRGVLERLGRALGEVGEHRVAGVAEEDGFAGWVDPGC